MAKSPEPKDKASFGWILWKILGGPQTERKTAAVHLGVNAKWLGQILLYSRDENMGDGRVSQKYIKQRKWAEKLATHYPIRWHMYKGDFEARLQQQPSGKSVVPKRVGKEPKDKGSFGWILWKICGGSGIDRNLAAKRLGINPDILSQIFHHSRDTNSGTGKISQKFIKDKNWRAILEKNYNLVWSAYKEEFEDRVLQQPAGPSAEPTDKQSLGWLVWTVLGGDDLNIEDAAEKLNGVKPRSLHRFMHNRHHPLSQDYIEKNNWFELLRQHYPKSFTLEHQIEFHERALKLSPKRGTPSLAKREKEVREESADASTHTWHFYYVAHHLTSFTSAVAGRSVDVMRAFSPAARWVSSLRSHIAWPASSHFEELDRDISQHLAETAGVKNAKDLQKRIKQGDALNISAEAYLALHYLMEAFRCEGRLQLRRANGLLTEAPTAAQLERWAGVLAPQLAG